MFRELKKVLFSEKMELSDGTQIPIEKLPDTIRTHLTENKFKEAFLLCHNALKDTAFLQKFQ